MSLQVWLPLNGDLHNQGLLDKPSAVVLQSGNSFTANGKIGQCLSSTNTNVAYFQDTSNNKLISLFNSGQIYTMAFWYKLTGNGTSGSIIQIGTTTPSSGSGNGTFGFWWTNDNNGTNPRIVWNDGDNGKRILSKANDNSDIATDYTNWHHLVAIIDKTNMAAQRQIFYIDGIKVRDQIYNNSSANALTITNANNYIYFRPYYALLNDFRIYDHALSDKEIEELAKGLVLHYKLDQSANINYNLYTGSKGFTGTWVNGSAWTTDVDTYNGFTVKKKSSIWGGLAQNVTATNGDIFTISFWAKVDSGGNILSIHCSSLGNVTTGLTMLDGNFESKTNEFWVNAGTDGTQWKRYWATLQITSADITYLQWRIENSVADKNLYVAGITLEKGYGTKNWSPSTSEAGTTNIVYDSSGYQRNGTILGAPIINSETGKYSNSLLFDGTDDGILIENKNLAPILNYTCSISFWIKTSTENGGRSIYFSSYNGSPFWCIEKSAANKFRYDWNGSPDLYSTGTIMDNTWNFICFVRENATSAKFYLNGELNTTWTTACNPLTNLVDTWRIARDVRTGDGTPYKGNMSDFRIYATALTEEQVLDLYHTSGTIDNKGNIYARKFEENDQLNLTKTGIFGTSNIYDNDELTKASILKTDKQVQGNTLYEY